MNTLFWGLGCDQNHNTHQLSTTSCFISIPFSVNGLLTWRGDAASHLARNVAVPSPEAAGPVRGSDYLRAGRTTGRTAGRGPVGQSPPQHSCSWNPTTSLWMRSAGSRLSLLDIFQLPTKPERNEMILVFSIFA